jgi:hypothetical protein
MRAAEVVVGHPGVQELLGLLERVEAVAGQQFGSEGLVESFDLAGGVAPFDGQGWWLGQATCLMLSWSVAVSNSSGVR